MARRERRRRFEPPPEPDIPPLRERFPEYAATFGTRASGLIAVGLVVFVITDLGLLSAVGHTFFFGGAFLILVGGARGGGYTNLGMGTFELFTAGRDRVLDDRGDLDADRETRRRDALQRLRRGLRPEANPTALWDVIAGFAFMAIGLPLAL